MPESMSGLYIALDKLQSFGENTARRLAPSGFVNGRVVARDALDSLDQLRRAHDRLEREYRSGTASGASEWLLDNWYLAQRECRGAAADISAVGKLRACRDGAILIEIAGALVRSGIGEITQERMELFLTGAQKVLPLSRAELALLTPALRCALVSELARIASNLTEAGSAAAMGAAFSSLRLLATLDLSKLIDSIDLTEAILRHDPAGVYPGMDERTRDMYRRRVTELAEARGTDEQRLARAVLALAEKSEGEGSHVGHWLFTRPMGDRINPKGGACYIAASLLVTLFLSLLGGFMTRSAAIFFLLLIPVSELVKSILDFILLRFLRPRLLPRMELLEGVPAEGRTICVISCLLTSKESGAQLSRSLEEYSLASRDCGNNLLFGLLADLPEAAERSMEGDEEAIDAAKAAIDGLNKKYGGGFYLLSRRRTLSARDGRWMGYERKRGAVESLAELICGDASGELCVTSGDPDVLAGTKYILTLDSDTKLLPGAARELIGAMLHPLNKPKIDKKRLAVTAGHAIIHPRMGVDLSSATKTSFSRAFAGQGGIDPYGSACGEVWMDLCGHGGFAGKGIIDAEALITCCSNLPENLILSHDALEGSLLRGGYMSDTELTDGFPSSTLSYFKRMHRWTRGDWQNISFIASSRFSDVDRWKLLDSLRRSLVAPLCLLSMLLAFFLPSTGTILAAAISLGALCFQLLPAMASALTRRGRTRYHSTVLHGFGGSIVTVFLRLILLPWEAAVCTDAIFAALWRVIISKRNMLLWQTAAQSDGGKGGLSSYLRAMWIPCLIGVVCVALSPSIIGRGAGIIWFFSPIFAQSMGKASKPRQLSDADQDFLLKQAADIWAYFDTYCAAPDHFLPPDNWQEQPPIGLAHRTSPTNIGLALTSCLAAADLGVASSDRALELIKHILDSVERLPKWKGHLYNWYDTRNLSCLNPKYVSTVDSGNFAACLIALSAGLREYGRRDLAKRAQELYDAIDFKPLYDTDRRLFHIGFNLTDGTVSDGLYDLLSSEARLTGYLAIARGDAPRRHWRRLSRAMVKMDGFRGMASWTGTTFEYLMPELFLPLCRDSLLYESARFCLYVQRRSTARDRPWGQSESAFFSLDPSLSYRYKAHGCSALALKRGMDEDAVVAPYSSFLALAVQPRPAVKNLRRFDNLDASGRFGFWEAVDFTPSRCRIHSGENVRCVMAHHLGMSLVAISNCLLDGVMQRRFMSDPAMSAHSALLTERVPIGGVILRRQSSEPPEKPSRSRAELWVEKGEVQDAARPSVCLLSNGVYNVMLTSTGLSSASAGGIGIYRGADSALNGHSGPRFTLQTGESTTDLMPLPGAVGGLHFSHSFSGSSVQFLGTGGGLSSSCVSAVSASDTCEVRIVELKSQSALEGQLVLELEPMLARATDYVNHPAFWRLGMHASESGGALLLRRLPRGDMAGCCLCLASDRELHFRANADGEALGWLNHPLITASTEVSISPGAQWSCRFVLAFGAQPEEALASARRALAIGPSDFGDMLSARAALDGLGARDVALTMDMAAALSFPRAAGELTESRDALWKLGISGDEPIICTQLDADSQVPALRSLIARHALLRSCGLRSDLVILTSEGGDYMRHLSRAVSDALAKLGLEALDGANGGVHLADSSQANAVRAGAAYTADLSTPEILMRKTSSHGNYPPLPTKRRGADVAHRWHEDGAFSFTVRDRLPRRSWTHMLANKEFGYLAADSGLGCMWYKNARECRINRWICDDQAVTGDETLECVMPTGKMSLFAAEDGYECRVEYGPGYASWEKFDIKVTSFVPMDTNARVLIIEGAQWEVFWRCGLTLSGDDRDSRFVITQEENNMLSARNARSPYPEQAFYATSSEYFTHFTCDLAAWLEGKPDGETGAGLIPCFAGVLPPAPITVIACGCCDPDELRALCEPDTALAQLAATKTRWARMCGKLRFATPDEGLNRYLNFWAVYQTMACRLLGRTSIYQSGGAYGYRDQLQDAVNLILVAPAIARDRILDACRHQYLEGDVMHWWHPQESGDKGVRTRCSDDLIWLPWAVCEYIDKTGDRTILDETSPWLVSKTLDSHELSRYEAPAMSTERDSVLIHASRALALVVERGTGEHGLPFIGSGDWNDGMDAVGEEGRGESVWLGWFFSHTSRRFAVLLDRLGQRQDAANLLSASIRFGRAADRAWDGQWYLRGYYDDGAPLGSHQSRACQIDSIAQSWAQLCAEAKPERKAEALDNALTHLFTDGGVAKLFTPPFTEGSEHAGYIKSYGPGFRENGGQYTHGALWLAMACFRADRVDEALQVLHSCLPNESAEYGAEPYVIAADIYSCPERYGQAGWSWYTGSAGWFFRIACEELLGFKQENGQITIIPSLPDNWAGWDAVWTDDEGHEHNIHVSRTGVTIDGEFTNILPFTT